MNSKQEKITSYSKKELAYAYKVSTKTLNRWLIPHLKELGLTRLQYVKIKVFTPAQIKVIFEVLGEP